VSPTGKGWLLPAASRAANRLASANPRAPRGRAHALLSARASSAPAGWTMDFKFQCDRALRAPARQGDVVLLEDLSGLRQSVRAGISPFCEAFFVPSTFLLQSEASALAAIPIASRPLLASGWIVVGRGRTGTVVDARAALIALGGLRTFAPWSNAFGKTTGRIDPAAVVALTFDDGPTVRSPRRFWTS